MTQAGLAEAVDISREDVVRLEAGRHDPKLSIRKRIAAALHVPIADLVDGAGSAFVERDHAAHANR